MTIDTLQHAVTSFYEHLSAGRFAECYRMVDPRVKTLPEGTGYAPYCLGLARFTESLRPPLFIDSIDLTVRPGNADALYQGRDFAVGVVHLRDSHARPLRFVERWVLDDDLWYTRCVGYLPQSG